MKKLLYILTLFTTNIAIAQSDFAVIAASPLDYQVPGTRNFSITIENKGSSGIASYSISWQLDNGPISTVNKTAGQTVWNGKKGLVQDASMQVVLPAAGTYILKAWLNNMVPTDSKPSNDTIRRIINVLPVLPKKNVVLEVFKHQACGPCYPAANYTDTFISKNPLYSVANIYTVTSDPLFNLEGANVDGLYGFAHPAPVFDRFSFPFMGGMNSSYTSGPSGYELKYYGQREQYYEPVEVYFESLTFDKTTRKIDINVGAKFYDGIQGNLRFNLYITEDSIVSFQATAPDPNKYYHKSVVRAMLGGSWGNAGSIPSTVKKNDQFYQSYTYTVPQNVKLKDLKLIALVQTYNSSDKYDRRILNSSRKDLKDVLTINNTTRTNTRFNIYPNPVQKTLHISFEDKLAKPCNVWISDINGKTLYSNDNCNNGTSINIKEFPSGNYFIYADIENVVHTKAFTKS